LATKTAIRHCINDRDLISANRCCSAISGQQFSILPTFETEILNWDHGID